MGDGSKWWIAGLGVDIMSMKMTQVKTFHQTCRLLTSYFPILSPRHSVIKQVIAERTVTWWFPLVLQNPCIEISRFLCEIYGWILRLRAFLRIQTTNPIHQLSSGWWHAIFLCTCINTRLDVMWCVLYVYIYFLKRVLKSPSRKTLGKALIFHWENCLVLDLCRMVSSNCANCKKLRPAFCYQEPRVVFLWICV